jgi:uncharacterized protein YbjT (DUF2867 family)
MIGTALSRHLLSEGYNVIILSRNPRETAVRHNLGTERSRLCDTPGGSRCGG